MRAHTDAHTDARTGGAHCKVLRGAVAEGHGLLDAVAGGFPPTEGRFDLAGISNGGLSAFRTALEHPDRFRSLALAPGAPPADATDEQFAALAGMRISQFVGGDDASWLAQSQASHDRLAALGIDSVLEVIAGDDHFLDSLEPSRVWDALGL